MRSIWIVCFDLFGLFYVVVVVVVVVLQCCDVYWKIDFLFLPS